MAGIVIATSPLTNTIFAGKTLKNQPVFREGKEDVTGMACAAVAVHVLAAGGCVVVSSGGKPLYEITAKQVQP